MRCPRRRPIVDAQATVLLTQLILDGSVSADTQAAPTGSAWHPRADAPAVARRAAPPPAPAPDADTLAADANGPPTPPHPHSDTGPPTCAPTAATPRIASNRCSTADNATSANPGLPRSTTPRNIVDPGRRITPGVKHQVTHACQASPAAGQTVVPN